jgi:putative transposase
MERDLWQGRYFSSALDGDYRWAAIRYVKRNPVAAGMVERAHDYPWSSAAARCGLLEDERLVTHRELKIGVQPEDWAGWLSQGDKPHEVKMLEKHVEKGLPCGEERFLKRLERKAGRSLRFRAQGRPFLRQ